MNRLPAIYSDTQMALIRRTVAKDCNDDEFSVFLENCVAMRLNPLRRQIYAFVFNKHNEKKRHMALVTAIGGMRAIADRTGNYRPDTKPPLYTFDEALVGPANPKGIVSAQVVVFKYAHGDWHQVTGEARWDEFAPIKIGDGGVKYLNASKEGWGGSKYSEGMPFLMLAKCAEAQALQKAWPDDFANIYSDEQTHHEIIDITPAEQAEAGERNERQARLGGGSAIMIDWMDEDSLDRVPHGELMDRFVGWSGNVGQEKVLAWAERNRHGLREFWAHAPTDALELKKLIEAARAIQEKSEAIDGEGLDDA